MVTTLLGPDGKPLPPRVLTEEAMSPELTGVRHLFDEFLAPGLTPSRLSALLRDAAMDDMEAYLTLAEEMEEREPHYRSVLATRKTALKSIEPFIRAPSEDKADVAIADAVKEELADRPDFRDLIHDLTDALGKGYSAVEIIWKTDGPRWTVKEFKWRDPRLFHFDRKERTELRIRANGNFEGLPLPPAKFIVHRPKLKSGITSRAGLARIAAWAFMLKSYTMKDWASFLEVHGMPLRLGKYGPGASQQDRDVLLRAVRHLARDAAAIIPSGMEIEFVEVKGFSEKPFETMAKYLDAQVSKAVIGQTMTADDGSSKSQSETHDKVRTDIKEDDAAALAVTLNRDIIRPWVDFNFGPPLHGRYPQVALPVLEREDLVAFSKGVGELVDRGLEIEVSEVRDRLGFREPKQGAALMRPGATVADRRAQEAGAQRAVNYRLKPSCPGCGKQARALNAAEDATEAELEQLSEEALGDWEEVLEPMRERLETEFAAASSYDDLNQRLTAVAADLPAGDLARALAIMALKARGIADANRRS